MKNDPRKCKAEQNGERCTRHVEKVGDLVCAGHWRMVPRDLRQLLIREQYKRASAEKQRQVVAAAGLVLAYIETCLVSLPPEGA